MAACDEAALRIHFMASNRRISLEFAATVYRALCDNPAMRSVSWYRWAPTFAEFLEANRERLQYFEESAHCGPVKRDTEPAH